MIRTVPSPNGQTPICIYPMSMIRAGIANPIRNQRPDPAAFAVLRVFSLLSARLAPAA